jgi:glycosyltransferase involved in cell wall biosynthesis
MSSFRLREAGYRFARSIYRGFRFFFGPMVRSRPRLHRFVIAVKLACKESFRLPLTVYEIPVQPLQGPLPEADARSETIRTGIPKWLIEEWKAVHDIEPQLFPDLNIQFNIITDFIPGSTLGRHYLDLRSLCSEDINHVFLVPWLKRGGADLVALNYVKALRDRFTEKRIAVISTENADSPWASKLAPDTCFIEFGKRYPHLSPEAQEKLLVRVLLQMAPRVIHNVNSLLGYNIFIKYGRALGEFSRLYASAFCEDIMPSGRAIGYPICFLPRCFDVLTAVISENEYILKKLSSTFAFEEERMFVHYQPVGVNAKKVGTARTKTKGLLYVLWASRLDVQKRPDILIKIAERSRDLPVSFHVYGTPVYGTSQREAETYIKSLNALPNVKYLGAFDGLPSLPVQDYDVYLYTSQWDGLPNTLLEAVSLGLPVIASAVGGIPELIQEGKTGFLVRPYDNVGGYVDILRMIDADPSVLKGMVERSLELIHARHSWRHFLETLERIPFYCRTEVSV